MGGGWSFLKLIALVGGGVQGEPKTKNTILAGHLEEATLVWVCVCAVSSVALLGLASF